MLNKHLGDWNNSLTWVKSHDSLNFTHSFWVQTDLFSFPLRWVNPIHLRDDVYRNKIRMKCVWSVRYVPSHSFRSNKWMNAQRFHSSGARVSQTGWHASEQKFTFDCNIRYIRPMLRMLTLYGLVLMSRLLCARCMDNAHNARSCFWMARQFYIALVFI